MNDQLKREFYSLLNTFLEEHNLDFYSPELRNLIRELDLDVSSKDIQDNYNDEVSDSDLIDSEKIQQIFLSDCLSYLDSHPTVMRDITSKYEELKNTNIPFDPDINFALSVSLNSVRDKITSSEFIISVGGVGVLQKYGIWSINQNLP